MSSYPSPTTGVGVAANILVAGNAPTVDSKANLPGYNNVILSISGTTYPTSFQLNPEIVDAAGTPVELGTEFTLSAAANASGGTTEYTGTITGGGTNAFKGYTFVVAGFTTAANNGTFICTASSTTTLTLENADGVSESHAATATSQEITSGNKLTYVAYGFKSNSDGTYNPQGSSEVVCEVSADGVISLPGTPVEGGSVVEISFPTFDNTSGTTGAASGNPMYDLPLNKIYAEVNVTVVA